MSSKIRSRKMRSKSVITKEKEIVLCSYIKEMASCGLPLTPTQIKIKVGQMIQDRITPFKNGIPIIT